MLEVFEMMSTVWGHSNVFGAESLINRIQDSNRYQTLLGY